MHAHAYASMRTHVRNERVYLHARASTHRCFCSIARLIGPQQSSELNSPMPGRHAPAAAIMTSTADLERMQDGWAVLRRLYAAQAEWEEASDAWSRAAARHEAAQQHAWKHGGAFEAAADRASAVESAAVQRLQRAQTLLNAARGAFYVHRATHARIDNDDFPVAAPTQDESSSCSDDAESGEDEVTWWPADEVMHDEADDDVAAAAEDDEASGSDDENDASVAEAGGDGENDAAAAEWPADDRMPALDEAIDALDPDEFWAFAWEDAAGR